MSYVEPRRKKRKRESGFNNERDEDESRGSNGNEDRRSKSGGYMLKRVDKAKFPPGFFDMLEEEGNATAGVELSADKIESESSRVWILQCPANVNLAELISGRKINLEGTTDLELESSTGRGKLYEVVGLPKGEASEKQENLVALLPDASGNLKLAAAPVSGYIMVRESLEELPVPKLLPNPKPPHTLPDGIKERHPIYGSDFTKVFEEISANSKKSKKKKKKKRDTEVEVNSARSPSSTVFDEIRAAGKTKHNAIDGIINNSVHVKVESDTPKKRKKRSDDCASQNGTNFNGISNGHHDKSNEPPVSTGRSRSKNNIVKQEVVEAEATEPVKKRSKKSKR